MTRSAIRRRWLVRLGIGLAPALALALSASPAQAEEPGFVEAFGADMTIGAAGSPGKAAVLLVFGNTAKNPTISIDLSGLAGIAVNTETPEGCARSGATIACPLPEDERWETLLPLPLQPAAGVKPGASGQLKWTTKADNVTTRSGSLKVSVADGVDLVVTSGNEEIRGVRPGAQANVAIAAANLGSQSTSAVSLMFVGDRRLQLVEYENCQYTVEGEMPIALCMLTFDKPLAPGEAFEIVDGFGVILAADALFEAPAYMVQPADAPAALSTAMKLRDGNGSASLRAARVGQQMGTASTDIDEMDNFGGAIIIADSSADIAAKGTSIQGPAGSVVDATIGVQNLGPATLESRAGEPVVHFEFVVPPGTEVTQVGNECYIPKDNSGWGPPEPGKPRYICFTDYLLKAGSSWTVTFKLKINEVIPNAKGEVRVVKSYPEDPNQANNVADVVVNPASGNGGDGGDGGTLPITGVQAGVIGAVGAAILALGAVLFVISRRRRVILVAGEDGTE